MKKIVLAALNAKYVHTNLAVRSLKAYAGQGHDIQLVERTINDNMDDVLDEIISACPDAVGFSCYIWNVEHIKGIASNLKKVLPKCMVFMGGPEVSYECEAFLENNPYVDMIIKGEGELTFLEWLKSYESGEDFSGLLGAAFRKNGKIYNNGFCSEQADLDTLPFVYDDLAEYENKIIYFETSRGCPMRCAYCMSGLAGQMSFMSFEKVSFAFEHFIKNNVCQVKLVDRTFNHPLARAKEIIKMLIELKAKYPMSETNFHFEITASICDDEFLELLRNAPDGLLQFEAGVQSTNPDTLKAISRSVETKRLTDNIKKIAKINGITLYADLIAGLPLEDYKSFAQSFNDVYSLGTEKIHLGFLKVLKGSTIKDSSLKYGIVYSDKAPYKVLKTKDISYHELRMLEKIEHILELYKNSGNFAMSEKYAAETFGTPFEFYEKFTGYCVKEGFLLKTQSIVKQFDAIFDFLNSCMKESMETFRDKLRYDWALMEKPGRYPKCIEPQNIKSKREFVRSFYNNPENIEKYLPEYKDRTPSEISRMCHMEFVKNGNKAVLFNYKLEKSKRAKEIVLKD